MDRKKGSTAGAGHPPQPQRLIHEALPLRRRRAVEGEADAVVSPCTAWRAMSVAFFAFGRGLCSSQRLLSWLGVLKARCTAAPAANATAVTSHIGQRRAWCAQPSTWHIALVLLDASCCCWMPAAASRRISSRPTLGLQRFAAVNSGCQCCLQPLCGSRIALLPF